METLVVVVPYDKVSLKARSPEFMGPFSIKLDPNSLARMVRERYGDNLHWQIVAKCDWSKVIPHIRTVLEASVKDRILDDGVILALEVLMVSIIEWETSKKVEVNKDDEIKAVFQDGRGFDH